MKTFILCTLLLLAAEIVLFIHYINLYFILSLIFLVGLQFLFNKLKLAITFIILFLPLGFGSNMAYFGLSLEAALFIITF